MDRAFARLSLPVQTPQPRTGLTEVNLGSSTRAIRGILRPSSSLLRVNYSSAPGHISQSPHSPRRNAVPGVTYTYKGTKTLPAYSECAHHSESYIAVLCGYVDHST